MLVLLKKLSKNFLTNFQFFKKKSLRTSIVNFFKIIFGLMTCYFEFSCWLYFYFWEPWASKNTSTCAQIHWLRTIPRWVFFTWITDLWKIVLAYYFNKKGIIGLKFYWVLVRKFTKEIFVENLVEKEWNFLHLFLE